MAIITPTQTTKTSSQPPNHSNGHTPSVVAAPDHGRYVSKEEYWAVWYEADPSYEWNNGYLEAKPMPNVIQLRLFHWFLEIMRQYVATMQNAELMGLETGFTMSVPNDQVANGASTNAMKEVIRKPDLAAILHTNPVTWEEHQRSYHGICDLCIEAISDSSKEEILRDTAIKKSEYEFAGVQEYYILDPSGENMHFYARAADGTYEEMEPNAQGVIQSSVLPGFQFRYSDLKRQRSLESLALDEVYRGFVLLHYQAAVARAEAAAERADAADERADAADERAKQYAAKLRELGIDPDTL